MSRTAPAAHSSIVSKTAFDLLASELSDHEESEEEVEVPEPVVDDTPAKPSKSAIKKAARLARTERRQLEKAAAKALKRASAAATPTSLSSNEQSPVSRPEALPEEQKQPETLQEEAPPEKQVPEPPTPAPVTLTNGDSHPKPPPMPTQLPPKPVPFAPAPSPPQNGVHAKPGPVATATEQPVTQESQKTLTQPAPPSAPAQDGEAIKKRQNLLTRTLWTFIMIGGFITLLLMGHPYMILLVMVCQTLVYREVTALFSLKSTTPKNDLEAPQGKDPWSKTLNWYFFAVTNYFLYGESIIYYFKHVVFADAQMFLFATNHRMISFTLYTFGFVGFVMSLKKGYLKQQFGLFCWVHMTLLLIVVSSHFIVNNILEGLIWFFVPASLVICNDVFAYVWGITLGRTPLIKLSPKKTVEGFIGAFWSTMIFALLWGSYFMRFDYMICPVRDLGVSAWSSVACRPNPVFLWKSFKLIKPVSAFISTTTGLNVTAIPYTPYHLHLLVMAGFASLVAPFGGFFASGFKRAFNIKDFGHSIPGHGGMTDRMDCQFLMGVFMYVYYSSLIREHNVTVGSVLQTIVSGLTIEEQVELIGDLRRYLQGRGVEI